MRTAFRSNAIIFGVIFLLAINWLSDHHKDPDLPGWLQFVRTIYGSFAIELISSISLIAFLYLVQRQAREAEARFGRFKTTTRWIFYCGTGVIVLGIFFDIWRFLVELHANG